MLKQPVGVVNFTNVAIVRLKIAKKKFEIACYKNKIQSWRNKLETDITQVLQSDKIYKNAVKGDQASHEEIKEIFKIPYEDVIKVILDKGEVQVNDKERNLNFSNIKNDIANLIVEKTYNMNTGLPFPQPLILQVLNDIHFDAKEGESSKKQAVLAIKLIQERNIIPIERHYMQIQLTVKQGKLSESDFTSSVEKIQKFLEESKAIFITKNDTTLKGFVIVVNILPNFYREIINAFEDILNIEVLNSKISLLKKTNTASAYEDDFYKTKKVEDNLYLRAGNLKISNSKIDDFFDNNVDEDDVNTVTKKAEIKKKFVCSKCKGSSFTSNEELRVHCKSEWHTENARRMTTSNGLESLTAEEFTDSLLIKAEEEKKSGKTKEKKEKEKKKEKKGKKRGGNKGGQDEDEDEEENEKAKKEEKKGKTEDNEVDEEKEVIA